MVVEDLDDASRARSLRYRPSGTFSQSATGVTYLGRTYKGSLANVRLAAPATSKTPDELCHAVNPWSLFGTSRISYLIMKCMRFVAGLLLVTS